MNEKNNNNIYINMVKKCPPGLFCIDNVTLLLLFILSGIILILGLQYIRDINNKKTDVDSKIVIIDREKEDREKEKYYNKPSSILSNMEDNIFLNPYNPPLKENRFIGLHQQPIVDIRKGLPINVPTSHYDLDYKQVGILTRMSGKETIIPLFGRPLHSNRNKWQYYTMTDKNNMIRLPVSKGGRSCTNEYGCDEIFSGDTLYVEGYKDAFNVTIYDTNSYRTNYIPYL